VPSVTGRLGLRILLGVLFLAVTAGVTWLELSSGRSARGERLVKIARSWGKEPFDPQAWRDARSAPGNGLDRRGLMLRDLLRRVVVGQTTRAALHELLGAPDLPRAGVEAWNLGHHSGLMLDPDLLCARFAEDGVLADLWIEH